MRVEGEEEKEKMTGNDRVDIADRGKALLNVLLLV